jgi:hypothetical protein
MKKPAIFLITIFCLRIFISCCDCIETVSLWYTIQTVATRHIDNRGAEPVYSDSGTIPARAYGIKINLYLQQYALRNRMNLMGFQSSFATSCDCPPEFLYLPQDTITGIRIIMLDDSAVPAESDETARFSVLFYTSYISVSDFLQRNPEEFYEQASEYTIELYIMKPEGISGEKRFRTEISLSGGRTVSTVSTPVNLI